MNQMAKQNGNKNTNTLFFVLAFMLFSFGTVIGQTNSNADIESNTQITTDSTVNIVSKQENASTNSSMNFILWFMGTKQDPNVKISPSDSTTKKQFMTSGSAPNRILMKAFLKKAVNFETATV